MNGLPKTEFDYPIPTDEEFMGEVLEGEKLLDEKVVREAPIISAKDLMTIKYPETTWIVEGLIPSEGFTALTGTPASYKSFLTEHLAVCLTSDSLFLNHFKVTPTSVFILDKENSLPLLQTRFTKLGLKEEAELYFLQDPDSFKIQSDEHLNWLISFIKDKQIGLLIIDSFAHVHKGDENDSQAIVATFERLKQIPCAILFIHHHRKTIKFFTGTPLESIRGSSDIAAELESHIAVDQTTTGLRVAQYKNRRGELTQPFLITPLATEETMSFSYGGQIEEEVEKAERAKELIIELLISSGEIARKQIVEALSEEVGRNSIDTALRTLEDGKQLKIRFEGRSKFFSLSPDVSPYQGDSPISPLEQSYLEEVE